MFLGVLAPPGYDADVGEMRRDRPPGLAGGDETDVAAGRS